MVHIRRCDEREAHPRSRGENNSRTFVSRSGTGSSPLTRGKPSAPVLGWDSGRLIPAHAGKTGDRGKRTVIARAHPRSRGENTVIEYLSCNPGGSSPLTRGKPRVEAREVKRGRLIPAHAGKTRTPRSAPSLATAHPRSRGENWQSHQGRIPSQGSSPLTRGKRRRRWSCRRR